MLRFVRIWMIACSLCLCFGGKAVAAQPVIEQHAITIDAQIDSRDPTFNYGLSTTAKVLVNGLDGSLTRTLFAFPSEIWSIGHERLVSARVWFYVWFDQTGTRTVRLHPLTRVFAEGTGDATLSGDGATWLSSDGQTMWTTAGGDYDPGFYVDAVEGGNWFSWDITALWDNEGLRSYGAILKMNDESDPGYPNMPRAPFTSSEGPANERPYVEILYQPEESLCGQRVVWADADGDGDVDQDDFAVFQKCYSGSGESYPSEPAGCECLDVDGDGSIDASDYQEWEKCVTGPEIPWSVESTPNCRSPER
ncbi:MAG: hypothetical protein GXY44_01195 [Phycisphaerales bacterium]|nr:hypothetical protein [Phycisphaerales bacterium]